MVKQDKRRDAKPKLEVGVDVPPPGEIRRIIDAAAGNKWRPFLILLPFSGLRASEVRGLRWSDVDLKAATLTVNQRVDAWRNIGEPKSASSRRTIPLAPIVCNTLRQWKLESGGKDDGLVFHTSSGGPVALPHLLLYVWHPAQRRAGVVSAGEPKYYGLHSLRHFFASWCINARADGGRELQPKAVQALLGHANLALTMDRYGHLFPSSDNGAELAAAEKALLSAV
jgi:integrase